MNNHPLESLVETYLGEKDITKRSFDLYNTILNQYINYLKQHQIIYAKKSDVVAYIKQKQEQKYSTRWIYLQISTIKGLYQYLRKHQKRLDLPIEYARDITESIKNVRIKNDISKPVLKPFQAKQLILTTKNNRKYIWHYRDHAIVYLMITTGMRSVEVRRAKQSDLKPLNNQWILYIQGKGRKYADEFVKITPDVKEAIDDYLTKRSDTNPYLFISHSNKSFIPSLSRTFFNAMIKRVLKETGLEDTHITAHSLRHTAATLNLLRGESLEATRRFMRHKDMASTMIYAHHITRMDDDSESKIEQFILDDTTLKNKKRRGHD